MPVALRMGAVVAANKYINHFTFKRGCFNFSDTLHAS